MKSVLREIALKFSSGNYILQDSSQLRNWMIPEFFGSCFAVCENTSTMSLHFKPKASLSTLNPVLNGHGAVCVLLTVYSLCAFHSTLFIMADYFRNLWNVRYILPLQQTPNCKAVASSGVFISF